MQINKITFGLIIIGFFFCSCRSSSGVKSKEKLPRIENVHFSQNSDTVRVYYDLLAKNKDTKFDVKLLLSLGENQNFEITSPAASGDLGKNVFPGKERRIEWSVLQDFPNGVDESNIQFMVNAENMSSSVNKKWIYITAGAVLVGAGTTLGLIWKSDNDNLPFPPGRPAIHK
ncbi:MAG: hypothetical protein HUJ22_02510 [Gracilimonas sp.]|uniref:hypothetical protein n=1 Tax=Gracilimonas sp. TaxID=1974203 RepID=UPI0019AC1EDD|nr:hypothetical protein [Gracilimonas sp.]MBD3615417.1 hypothetical protein [Gracilimonas sp.]